MARQPGSHGLKARSRTGQLFTMPTGRTTPGWVTTGANECGIVLTSPSQLCMMLFSQAVHKPHRKGNDPCLSLLVPTVPPEARKWPSKMCQTFT